MDKHFFIYIVKCSDKSYYTGITNNVEIRLHEHNEGINKDCYTFTRRPVILVYVEYYDDPLQAIRREKQIKRWSRNKKQSLIIGNTTNLIKYSKSKNIKYHRGHTSTSSV